LSVNERFWSASLEELKQGYIHDRQTASYICLICGATFEDGQIYPEGGRLYEAWRYAGVHIERDHDSMLDYLLGLDKKSTGLTELQKELIADIADGLSDADIVKKNGSGSASTIRNHRFALKERAKQAKLFLAIMELIDKGPKLGGGSRAAASGAGPEAHAGRDDEHAAIVRRYFPEGGSGPLLRIPAKEKRRIAVLKHLAERFEADTIYTEKEVNELLMPASEEEYVTLRRYLVEYRFLDRKDDGSAYWLIEGGSSRNRQAEGKVNDMEETRGKETRKQLVQQYQDKKREMGVYRIVHRATGKTWVGTSMNLDKVLNRDTFMLDLGSHANRALQADWKAYGMEAFEMDILEQLKLDDAVKHDYKDIHTPEGTKDYVVQDYKRRLAERERHWIRELGSEEPAGYNKKGKGDQVP